MKTTHITSFHANGNRTDKGHAVETYIRSPNTPFAGTESPKAFNLPSNQ